MQFGQVNNRLSAHTSESVGKETPGTDWPKDERQKEHREPVAPALGQRRRSEADQLRLVILFGPRDREGGRGAVAETFNDPRGRVGDSCEPAVSGYWLRRRPEGSDANELGSGPAQGEFTMYWRTDDGNAARNKRYGTDEHGYQRFEQELRAMVSVRNEVAVAVE